MSTDGETDLIPLYEASNTQSGGLLQLDLAQQVLDRLDADPVERSNDPHEHDNKQVTSERPVMTMAHQSEITHKLSVLNAVRRKRPWSDYYRERNAFDRRCDLAAEENEKCWESRRSHIWTNF